jgi:tripartite-type tricarboxylate transporter receptor subunit TctC
VPDIPTIAEAVPGFESSSWNGFLAPAATPAAIIEAIRSEVTAFVGTPDISQRLTSLGIVPGGLTAEQIKVVFQHERESYAAAIKAAGIPPPD